MKTKINLFIALASTLAFVACNDSFEILPETKVPESPSMFHTEAGLQAFSNGFYETIDPNVIKDDKFSDNMEHISTPPVIRSKLYVIPTALKSGGWNWDDLRHINYFITNVERHTTDVALRNRYLALGKFFRAWFYFQKVKTFGDVPWYSNVLSTNDDGLFKARDSRADVMDSILVDLNFAIRHLPSEKSKNRATKWTALALKSRIALFEGTWRIYHTSENLPNAEKWLQECIDASKQLIDESGYTLYQTGNADSDYKSMFQLAAAPTDEVIFARSSSQNFIYYTPEFTSTSNGNYGATHSLVADYAMRDGGSYFDEKNGSIDAVLYFDEFQDRDLRLQQSVVHPGYVRIGTSTKTVNDFATNRTGYQVTKRVGPPIEDQGNDNRDVILFRYAEVLLNYAEARAILGQLTQQDLDISVNRLRARAGVATGLKLPLRADALQLQRYKRTSDAEVLEICRERRVELAFEGFRRDDLLRWNEGHLFRVEYYGIYIPGYNQFIDLDRDGKDDLYIVRSTDDLPADRVSGVQYLKLSSVNALSEGDRGRLVPYQTPKQPFEDWEYLNPIPLEELTINPNLVQNPGWDTFK